MSGKTAVMRSSGEFSQTDPGFVQPGLGGAPLGNYPEPLADEVANETIRRALDLGIRLFDTAPLYGYGLSELRLGNVFSSCEIPREKLFLSSKAGRVLVAGRHQKKHELFPGACPFHDVFDYSYRGIMHSVEGSLERLKTDYLDILHVHDPGELTHGDQAGLMLDVFVNEGYRAMLELREQGVIRAIGLGVNECEVALTLLQVHDIDLDCLLLAQRHTLLEQHEKVPELFALCRQRGIVVLIGAPLSSGILAGDRRNSFYQYAKAGKNIVEKKDRIAQVCGAYQVDLLQAALHFPLLQPAVQAVVMGARSAQQVEQAVSRLKLPVPPALWEDLVAQGLIRHETENADSLTG